MATYLLKVRDSFSIQYMNKLLQYNKVSGVHSNFNGTQHESRTNCFVCGVI